jgi:phosphotransferase system  glucose/maltose/N-acetylglucosamine-specific IIC component
VRRILGALLLCLGGILAVAALLLLGDAVSAWIERLQYGSGLMFADAEVFFVLGLAIGATGGAVLWAALRLMGLLPGRTRD